jgi:hypothetical protein
VTKATRLRGPMVVVFSIGLASLRDVSGPHPCGNATPTQVVGGSWTASYRRAPLDGTVLVGGRDYGSHATSGGGNQPVPRTPHRDRVGLALTMSTPASGLIIHESKGEVQK